MATLDQIKSYTLLKKRLAKKYLATEKTVQLIVDEIYSVQRIYWHRRY